MTFLAHNLEGLFVPAGTKNPCFAHTTGFGPSWVREAFTRCINKNVHQMRVALPWGNLVLEAPFNDADDDIRELIYLAYSEERRWIFVYDITEGLGLLFSEDDPARLLEGIDIDAADQQFRTVCDDWIATHNVKHAAAVRLWLELRTNG